MSALCRSSSTAATAAFAAATAGVSVTSASTTNHSSTAGKNVTPGRCHHLSITPGTYDDTHRLHIVHVASAFIRQRFFLACCIYVVADERNPSKTKELDWSYTPRKLTIENTSRREAGKKKNKNKDQDA